MYKTCNKGSFIKKQILKLFVCKLKNKLTCFHVAAYLFSEIRVSLNKYLILVRKPMYLNEENKFMSVIV